MCQSTVEAVMLSIQVVALAVIGGAVRIVIAKIDRNADKLDKLNGGEL